MCNIFTKKKWFDSKFLLLSFSGVSFRRLSIGIIERWPVWALPDLQPVRFAGNAISKQYQHAVQNKRYVLFSFSSFLVSLNLFCSILGVSFMPNTLICKFSFSALRNWVSWSDFLYTKYFPLRLFYLVLLRYGTCLNPARSSLISKHFLELLSSFKT